jgi:hypothetical protein
VPRTRVELVRFPATPSKWCVCQFRHLGKGCKSNNFFSPGECRNNLSRSTRGEVFTLAAVQPPAQLLSRRLRQLWPFVPTGLLLLAFTFPVISPYFGPGLDPPLAWVFNSIVQAGNQPGRDFVFPHGPLSFLMYPLPVGHHLFITLALITFLKFIFFVQVSWLYGSDRAGRRLLAFAAAYAAFLVFEIQFLMLGVMLSAFVLFLRNGKSWLIFLPAAIAVLAVYLRAYITVLATVSLFLFATMLYFRFHRKRPAVAALAIFVAGIVLTWLALYGSLHGLAGYLKSRAVLSLDNSTAVAYYPENNAWLLAVSLLAVCAIPFVVQDARVTLFFLLFLPALFAQWKYSMAREDTIHARGFVVFLFLLFLLLAPLVRRRRRLVFTLALVSLGAYYANLRTLPGYFEWTVQPFRFNACLDFVTHYPVLEKQWQYETQRAIAGNILPDSVRRYIGSDSVDAYPWDYSYLPANEFHWQPRPALQSYAAYTSWLDECDAVHFRGPQAPRFLLWHLAGPPGDQNGCTFESLDNRYVLNDEPRTVLEFIRRYSVHSRTAGWLLFEKRAAPLALQQAVVHQDTTRWNQWTRLPAAPGALLRVRAGIATNLAGKLKSFLYKGEAVYLLLRTEHGEIFSFRIVPANAADGLWINPLILHPGSDGPDGRITEILFASSSAGQMHSAIPLTWEAVRPASGEAGFLDAWLKRQAPAPDASFSSRLQATTLPAGGWHAGDGEADRDVCLTPPASWKTAPHGYSATFECRLDTLPQLLSGSLLEVRAGGWAKYPDGAKAGLSVSLEDSTGNIVYASTAFGEFSFSVNGWRFAPVTVELTEAASHRPGARVKVFAWNDSSLPVRVDDLCVTLRAR